MTGVDEVTPVEAGSAGTSVSGWPLLRWFISYATLSVPQAAGPMAFGLLALETTGNLSGGAAMILAMTLAQVAGAIPITRLGRNVPSSKFLKLLVGIRTFALACITLLAAYGAPFVWLIVLAVVAGSVSGAAYGHLRTLLNQLVPSATLPRALGISVTVNEVTFVLAPVAASVLGSVSPVGAILVIAVLGAVPLVFVPHIASTHAVGTRHSSGSVVTPRILLWLMCAAASGAVVAIIEIGAVALALKFEYRPALAIVFTIPLCLASVAGGLWVSVRNKAATGGGVLLYLCTLTLGSTLVALGNTVATTLIGAVLIGAVLAPLGTHYSLALDVLSPPEKRPEVFALLRTSNAVGIIFASAVMTAYSLDAAIIVVSGVMVLMTIIVGVTLRRMIVTGS